MTTLVRPDKPTFTPLDDTAKRDADALAAALERVGGELHEALGQLTRERAGAAAMREALESVQGGIGARLHDIREALKPDAGKLYADRDELAEENLSLRSEVRTLQALVQQTQDEVRQAKAETEGLRQEMLTCDLCGDGDGQVLAICTSCDKGNIEGAKTVERERIACWWDDTEARSAEAHAVYQMEAHRRGDVRHPDAYADLSEATKEWDRVLVRWVAESIRKAGRAP